MSTSSSSRYPCTVSIPDTMLPGDGTTFSGTLSTQYSCGSDFQATVTWHLTRQADSDHNGIPDSPGGGGGGSGGGGYNRGGPEGDLDGDGVSNFEELMRGTNPKKKDSDGDGVWDGQELRNGTSPLIKKKPKKPTIPLYVALGDSYSSGEGACGKAGRRDCAYYPSTNRIGRDECHRSHHAYPELYAAHLPSKWDFRFVACSGDVTQQLYSAKQEKPQLSALYPHSDHQEVRLVTLGIGGNDMRFSDTLKSCVQAYLDPRQPRPPSLGGGCTHNGTQDPVEVPSDNEISLRLKKAYMHIQTLAPKAKLYVMGYPHLFTDTPFQPNCTIYGTDARYIRARQNHLTEVIRRATLAANAMAKKHFAIFVDNGHTFDHHELCRISLGKSYLHSYLPKPSSDLAHVESFHPNKLGQDALYRTLRRVAG